MQTKSWMLSSVLAPIAAAGLVTLAVPTISYAATLASPAIINFDDCTGGCGQTQGSTTANFGSVTFTQVGTSEIDFTINLASGYDFFNSGNGTSFEFNTSDTSGLGTVASPPSNWSFVKPANSLDGLGAFQYGLQCGATGGTPNKTCGSTLTFDITGLNSNNIINNARGVFIAVDICFVSGTTCAGTGPVAVTGSAGVTPIPPALAMLAPVFGLGFFGLRRRRRQSGVASA